MYKPPFVVLDFETEVAGRGSTEYYRDDFRVTSAAFTWLAADGSLKSDYIEGENAVGYFLERLCREEMPLVAHNAEFEMGVVRCRYPHIADLLVWFADTMRLVQVYDNGGDKFALEAPLTLDDMLDAIELDESGDLKEPKKEATAGLGLVKAIRRILLRSNHKHEAHKWLRDNGVKKGQEGVNLGLLPKDVLRRYNVGDTEETARLCKFILDAFEKLKYNWRLDHSLYMSSVKKIVESRILGVPVNRSALKEYRYEIEQELSDLACQFRSRFAAEIVVVERSRLLLQIQKRKTFRGKRNYLKRARCTATEWRKSVLFNIGSNKQLESLFCGVMGKTAKFVTAKGSPAFRSAVLSQWGEGGELLKRRRKRLLVLKQCCSLLDLSAYDGRWHASLKACGTATGRFAGGSVV